MRGSLSAPSASASTARTDSLTRRMRSLIWRHHLPLDRHDLELLPVEIPLRLVEQSGDAALVTCDARDGEPRALPEVVVVDLGDGRTEPVLQLRLHGLHVLALSLQRARLGEVELDGEDADVAGGQVGYDAAAGAGSLRSVRSTCRVS